MYTILMCLQKEILNRCANSNAFGEATYISMYIAFIN